MVGIGIVQWIRLMLIIFIWKKKVVWSDEREGTIQLRMRAADKALIKSQRIVVAGVRWHK